MKIVKKIERIEKKTKENIFEIQEEVKIFQKDQDIFLEKGDKIKILNEGASTFYVLIKNHPSMESAYRAAVSEARLQHGWDPYNGTISTTDGFIEKFPPTTSIDSKKFRKWMDDQLDYAEKWGPAFGVTLPGKKYFFFGWAAE